MGRDEDSTEDDCERPDNGRRKSLEDPGRALGDCLRPELFLGLMEPPCDGRADNALDELCEDPRVGTRVLD